MSRVFLSKKERTMLYKLMLDNRVYIIKGEPFISSAGFKTPFFLDLRRLTGDGKSLDFVSDLLIKGVWKDMIDTFSGIETAGIPYAATMALKTNKKFFYVRRRKQEHGLMSIIAGVPPRTNQRVALVDDGVGWGVTVKNTIKNLKKEKVNVKAFIAIMDLGNFKKIETWFNKIHIPYSFLVTWQEWAEWMVTQGIMSQGRYDVAIDFLQDPISWANNKQGKWGWLRSLKKNHNYWFKGPQ